MSSLIRLRFGFYEALKHVELSECAEGQQGFSSFWALDQKPNQCY